MSDEEFRFLTTDGAAAAMYRRGDTVWEGRGYSEPEAVKTLLRTMAFEIEVLRKEKLLTAEIDHPPMELSERVERLERLMAERLDH